MEGWNEKVCVKEYQYILKILEIRALVVGPKHYHQRRKHSYYVFSGEIDLIKFDCPSGNHYRLCEGQSATIDSGIVHQVIGVKDSIVIFVSTQPEEDKVIVNE